MATPDSSLPPTDSDHHLFNAEDLRHNLKSRAVRGGAATLTAQIINFLITIGSLSVLGRLLAPDDFGVIGMVVVLTGFVDQLGNLGLSQATVQRDDITPGQVSNLFWLNVIFSFLVALLCTGLAPLLVWFYHEPRVLWVTIALAGVIAVKGLVVQHQALLQRRMRFHRLSAISVCSVAGGAVLAIVTAHWLAYWALVLQYYTVTIITLLGVWLSVRWMPRLPRRGEGTRRLALFGGHLTVVGLGGYLATNVDRLLIGRLFGTEKLGQYNNAVRLIQLPLRQIMPPTNAVALPTFSRLASDPVAYRRHFLSLFQLIALALMPAVAVMIPCGDWIIRLVLGPQWREAGWIFQAMSPIMMVQVLNSVLTWLFVTQDRTGAFVRYSLVNNFIAILSIVIGLHWGPIGVALGYTISGLLIRTPYLIYSVGRLGVVSMGDLYRNMLPAVWLAVCVLAVTLPIRLYCGFEHPIAGLLLAAAAAAVVLVSLWAAIPDYRQRLGTVKQFVRLYRSR